jgi:hypothetical protein
MGATFDCAGYLGLEVPADGTSGVSAEDFSLSSFPFENLIQVLRGILWVLRRFRVIFRTI